MNETLSLILYISLGILSCIMFIATLMEVAYLRGSRDPKNPLPYLKDTNDEEKLKNRRWRKKYINGRTWLMALDALFHRDSVVSYGSMFIAAGIVFCLKCIVGDFIF